MSHQISRHSSDVRFLAQSAPLPLAAELSLRLTVALVQWSTRARTRTALSDLDPHLLKDIGLTDDQAKTEANKRFWQV